MELHHQKAIIRAMAAPAFYPHDCPSIERRETHISVVFLTGEWVYKIKKPVDFGFLDFTTLEKRRHYCRQEVILNRRLAGDVYVDALPITLSDGQYQLDGSGQVVEYAVKMRQLPDAWAMDRRLAEGALGPAQVRELALLLARFYASAKTGGRVDAMGAWETVRHNCEENFSQTESFAGSVLDMEAVQDIRKATRAFLTRNAALFRERVKEGKIRDGHGDLKPEHIYFSDGIRIIDCIEFNRRFRYGDVTADLGFLCMDLDYLGYSGTALEVIRSYVENTGDWKLHILLDFYRCYRAFVKVKVNCFRLAESPENSIEYAALRGKIDRYLTMARHYARRFSRPLIWVVCGLPASGKSTVSSELAGAFGIRHINSDVVRKEIFNLAHTDRQKAAFGEGIYSRGASALTYGRLLLLAQEELRKGHSVVLDATWRSQHWRREVRRLAEDMGVALFYVLCRAPETVLRQRLQNREGFPSVSDAREDLLEIMTTMFAPLNELPDALVIPADTDQPLARCMSDILARIQAYWLNQDPMVFSGDLFP